MENSEGDSSNGPFDKVEDIGIKTCNPEDTPGLENRLRKGICNM